jgi:hypothetical protein
VVCLPHLGSVEPMLCSMSFPLCHIVREHPWFWTELRYVWILVHMVLFRHPMLMKDQINKTCGTH